MRSSRPTFRVKTPLPPASMAEVGVRADADLTPGTSNAACAPSTPRPAAGPETTSTKTSTSHPSLIALARLLGRQAAREWLVGGGEGGGDA